MAILKVARRLAERWARGKSVTRRLRIRGEEKRIKLSPDAQLKYLAPKIYTEDNEPLVQLAAKHVMRGFNVWDIGASCGIFSLAAAIASKGGRILAVDADGWQLSLIEETKKFEENKSFGITTLGCAISDKCDLLDFSIAERGRASNSLSLLGEQAQMGGSRSVRLTAAIDLDFLLNKTFPPDFIKIDIEGAEVMALDGAEKLFRTVRPTVFIEVREASQAKVVKRFGEFGYVAANADGDSSPASKLNSAWDVLFIPSEKIQSKSIGN